MRSAAVSRASEQPQGCGEHSLGCGSNARHARTRQREHLQGVGGPPHKILAQAVHRQAGHCSCQAI